MKTLYCLAFAVFLVGCSPQEKAEQPFSSVIASYAADASSSSAANPVTYAFTEQDVIQRMAKSDPSIAAASLVACTPSSIGADKCVHFQTSEGQLDIESHKTKVTLIRYHVIDDRSKLAVRNFKPTEAFMATFAAEPYTTVDRARIHREVDEYATITPGYRETEKPGQENRRWVAMGTRWVEVIYQDDGYTLLAAPLNEP